MIRKQKIYIGLFILLGFLIQAFVHGALEISYSILLWSNHDFWSFGLSYRSWKLIHDILMTVLLFLGPWYGYRQGIFWWKYLYEENGTLRVAHQRAWRI